MYLGYTSLSGGPLWPCTVLPMLFPACLLVHHGLLHFFSEPGHLPWMLIFLLACYKIFRHLLCMSPDGMILFHSFLLLSQYWFEDLRRFYRCWWILLVEFLWAILVVEQLLCHMPGWKVFLVFWHEWLLCRTTTLWVLHLPNSLSFCPIAFLFWLLRSRWAPLFARWLGDGPRRWTVVVCCVPRAIARRVLSEL